MRILPAVLAAALVLGACSDEPSEPDPGDADLPSPGASADPSPTASAEAAAGDIDVTTTPDEITPEWVTAVVNTILAEYGEMTAEILAMPVQDDPTLPDGFEDRLDALFEGQYLDFADSEARAFLVDADARRSRVLPAAEFSGLQFETERLQVVQDECLVIVGRVDRTGTRTDGSLSDELSAVSLSRSESGGPTPWELRDILANTDQDGNPNPDDVMLEASLDDYGSSLDHKCGAGS